jgi:UPF0716 protein FxsA
MRYFLIPLILLAFPVIEAVGLVWAAHHLGWWLLLWLLFAFFLGLFLIREERLAVLGRIAAAVIEGRDPLEGLFVSGRLMLAGLLLIFPGLLSDVLAFALLFYPRGRPPAGGIIEGQWRREE